MTVQHICKIGAGYVNGSTMAVIANRAEGIAALNDPDLSKLPVYEPGLDAEVGRARGLSLHFFTVVERAIAARAASLNVWTVGEG